MRIVAVCTGNAGSVHPAAEEGNIFINLFSYLTIWVVYVCRVRDDRCKMIEEVVSRQKTSGQLGPPGMTGSAGIQNLPSGKKRHSWIGFALRIFPLPRHVL